MGANDKFEATFHQGTPSPFGEVTVKLGQDHPWFTPIYDKVQDARNDARKMRLPGMGPTMVEMPKIHFEADLNLGKVSVKVWFILDPSGGILLETDWPNLGFMLTARFTTALKPDLDADTGYVWGIVTDHTQQQEG